ncbi:MAG: hypothetical protein K8S87_08990 [Planctomycetes bacterium]|nr:hypothetical protein [Planctomycetota bacterium]
MNDDVEQQKPKKKKKKWVLVFKGVVLLNIFLVVFNLLFWYSSDSQAKLMIEALQISEIISSAIEEYKTQIDSKDLTDLDAPGGTLNAGFVAGSPIFNKLKLTNDDFNYHANFDMEDFSIEFVKNGGDGKFIVVCEASKGKRRGKSGNGPVSGFSEYYPTKKSLSGKFFPTNFLSFLHAKRKK